MEPKHIDISEFRKLGYLQEVNRNFFHPLGLALEIVIDDAGNETIGGIWDYRDDPEGIIYNLKDSDVDRIKVFTKKADYIKDQKDTFAATRIGKFGFDIEPIPDTSSETSTEQSSEQSVTSETKPIESTSTAIQDKVD